MLRTRPSIHRFNSTYIYKPNCAALGPRNHAERVNDDGSIDLFALPCKSWRCSECAETLLLPRLRGDIETAIILQGLNLHVIFTLCRAGQPGTRDLSALIMLSWRKLTAKYKRHYKKALSYVWIREVKDGWPHLHVLTSGVDERWLKDSWHHLTGAHQVKVVPVTDPSTMAGYVTKQIHANALIYAKSTGRWWGKSAGLNIRCRPQARAAAPGKGKCKFVRQPLDRAECERLGARIYHTDRLARPLVAVVDPKPLLNSYPSSHAGILPGAPDGQQRSECPSPRTEPGPGVHTSSAKRGN